MRYLLDTNALSHLIRQPHGTVMQRIALVGEDQVCTSIIVAAEARFGALRRGSSRLTETLNRLLEKLEVVALDTPAEHIYASTRLTLERAGLPIGGNDLLIAAHTLALDYTLVTDNEREFSRVAGLRVENWLRG